MHLDSPLCLNGSWMQWTEWGGAQKNWAWSPDPASARGGES